MRKGSMFDVLFITIAVFIVAIVCLFCYMLIYDFKSDLEENPMTNITSVRGITANSITAVGSTADNIIVFLFFGLGMSTIIFAFLIDTHPVFFIVSILFLALLLVVAPVIANAYEDVASYDKLSDAANQYPNTKIIFDNYPSFILIIGALVSIALYAKLTGGGGGTY